MLPDVRPPPPPKHVIILDAETYYDRDYSLKKMTPPEYILDPRFELQMVAVKVDDGEHEIVDGPDFGKWIAQFDPSVTTTVTFNSLFDNSILAWHYGFVPHTMIDAMSMARTLLGHELTNFSLAHVSQFLGLPAKGNALAAMMGKRRDQIIAEGLWPQFCHYALRDNLNCEQIFLRLFTQMPWSERRLMDMVIRCAVEPRFRIDKTMLTQHLIDVRAAKAQLLADADGIDRKIIMSTPKFKEALEARGVEVAMKISPTTGKETPAFAKTDEFMEDLQNHADPVVAAMAMARIGLKSTLEETRSEKFINIANLDWPLVSARVNLLRQSVGQPPLDIGEMPMPLRFGGAHTHRLSGDWRLNVQNMPTVRGSKGKSKLRKSLIVPDDCRVVICDLSQIEARLVAWICGCTRLVSEFANKQDPYSLLATEIFGKPINRKLKDAMGELVFPIEGFIGKTGILGLGYNASKDKFDTMVIQTARKDGLDISQIYSRVIGDKAVDAYRRRYHEIPRGWGSLNQAIQTAWLSGAGNFKFGPCVISYGNVLLPSGLSLRYADPCYRTGEDGRTEYRYRYGKFWHKIYGAKLLENIVQALARIVVMNAALRIRDRGKHTLYPRDYRFVLQGHDELVFIIHKTELDNAKQVIQEEMTRRPSWALDAPIDAEIGEGASYGEAK